MTQGLGCDLGGFASVHVVDWVLVYPAKKVGCLYSISISFVFLDHILVSLKKSCINKFVLHATYRHINFF